MRSNGTMQPNNEQNNNSPLINKIDENSSFSTSNNHLDNNFSPNVNNNKKDIKGSKKKKDKNISFAAEIKRKLIHLVSLNIPLIYIFIEKNLALTLMLIVTFLTVAIDVGSKKIPAMKLFMDKFFGDILRKHEKKKKKFRLNGASWLTISACITIFIFPKIIAVVAFTILIISDISSALIGRRYGKHQFFKGKTIEGSLAFFISASIIVFIYYQVYNPTIIFLFVGLFAALVSAFFEALSKKIKIDDNLLSPISFSIVMWLGEYLANYFGQSYIHIL
jgi:dolichol kinase